MIRSTNQKLGEYDLIRGPDHVAKVWGEIEKSLPTYWAKFVQREQDSDGLSKLVAKFGKPGAAKDGLEGAVVSRVFQDAVKSYEKQAEKYRQFFDPEAMDEYQDDPNAFKQGLSRDVPVIANTLKQRHAELKEWQRHFRMCRANDLLAVFTNVMDFRAEWSESHPLNEYVKLDDPAAFDLDPLDDDENMFMTNVIGMGIKSILLYHLDPQRFPARGRYGLYGLFFLSGKSAFGLPSDSSEFLMINDLSPVSDCIIMDQNYWYPYGLFSLYSQRVFRWLDKRVSAAGIALDQSLRYVYVERFFEAVCAEHTEDLKTMRAHERFEVPG